MDDVLRDCATFAVVYIDDILIFPDSMEEHLNHITEVMKSLKKAGLKVKAKLRVLAQRLRARLCLYPCKSIKVAME